MLQLRITKEPATSRPVISLHCSRCQATEAKPVVVTAVSALLNLHPDDFPICERVRVSLMLLSSAVVSVASFVNAVKIVFSSVMGL